MGLTNKSRGRRITTGELVTIHMHASGTLAAGDTKALFKACHSGLIVKDIFGYVETMHSTSTGGGGTVFQVRNKTDTADLTTGGVTITDTCADGIEYAGTLQNTKIDLGDVLALDIDAIDSGTGAAELHVYLIAERLVT